MKNSYYDSPFTLQRLEVEPEVKIYHNDTVGCIRICHSPNEHHYYSDISKSDEAERIDAKIAAAVKTELLKMKAAAAKSSHGQKKRKRYPY